MMRWRRKARRKESKDEENPKIGMWALRRRKETKARRKRPRKFKEKYVDQEELNKTKLHMPHQCALMGEGIDEDEVTVEEPSAAPPNEIPALEGEEGTSCVEEVD